LIIEHSDPERNACHDDEKQRQSDPETVGDKVPTPDPGQPDDTLFARFGPFDFDIVAGKVS
jgi:hypothetical protein